MRRAIVLQSHHQNDPAPCTHETLNRINKGVCGLELSLPASVVPSHTHNGQLKTNKIDTLYQGFSLFVTVLQVKTEKQQVRTLLW